MFKEQRLQKLTEELHNLFSKRGEEMSVAVNEKKNFIKYFLNNFQLQRRECVWILNYLVSHEDILEKIHFVDNIEKCENAVTMSTNCQYDAPAFAGIVRGSGTVDPEKFWHFIRVNNDADIYIQLVFSDKNKNQAYLNIMEENPNIIDKNLKQYKKEAEKFINHCLKVHEKEALMHQIDKALDAGDEDLFKELSEKYREMTNNE
jgi:uncharacterized protein YpiB (UPF0302 family)